MTKSIAIKSAFSCGGKAIGYLQQISCKNIVIIRDEQMTEGAFHIISQIRNYMEPKEAVIREYGLTGGKISVPQLMGGIDILRKSKPDMVIALGSQQTIAAAKLMLIIYEYPEFADSTLENADTTDKSLHTKLVVISNASEDAECVNQVNTIKIDSHDLCFE